MQNTKRLVKLKRGETSPILVGVVLVILVVIFAPLLISLIASSDDAYLVCNDDATPTLDETVNLCTNASGVGVINATPSSEGFTVTEETVLGFVPLFLIVGALFFIYIKTIKDGYA